MLFVTHFQSFSVILIYFRLFVALFSKKCKVLFVELFCKKFIRYTMSDTLTVSNINYRTISGSTITASTIMGSTLSISTLIGSTMNISTLTGSTITGNQIYFSTLIGSTITSLTNNVTSIVYGDGSTQISSSPAMDDTTFGTNWSQNAAPLGTWRCIAGSSTGQYQIAGLLGQGIFLTRNYGQTWTQLTNTTVNGTTGTYPSGTTSASAWFDAAVSSSGKYMTIMTTGTGNLYVSSNYGITWVIAPSAATAANYQCASMSATGLYQLATISGGQLQLSINSGATWSAVATSKIWMGCGMSATGQYMTAVASTGGATAAGVFLSSNYGQTWTDLASYTLNSATGAYPAATTSNLDWSACAVSATGQYQIIARTVAPPYTTTLLLYTSSNYGITWTATASTAATSNTWNRMQVSASGQYQVATSVTPSVTTSLLNAYQFDLQDQSSMGVYNQVTGSYDGILVNGATISSASSKYATGSLSLTGSASQYLQLPSFTMTSAIATTGLTFATWMNLNTTQASYNRVFEFGQAPRIANTGLVSSGTATFIEVDVYTTSNILRFVIVQASTTAITVGGVYTVPYTPSTGTWTHVTWVLTGSSWTIYMNGVLQTPTVVAAVTVWVPPNGVYAYNAIGRSNYPNDSYTTGNFNDFRMYTTALSAANITTLYNATPNTLAYSTNFGANWSVASIRAADVAISTDGRNLSAACQGSFGIQQSAAAAPVTTITGTTVMNSTVATPVGQPDTALPASAYATLGQTWNVIPSLPSAAWSGCVVSATGQYMSVIIQGTAVPSGYNIYYSTNYGATWTLATGFLANGTFNSINMSGNGQYQIATIYGTSSVFYKSSNYGATWTASSYNVGPWLRSCLSYTGQYQYITNAYTVSVSAGGVYYSADYGATFTLVTPAATLVWVGICCSSTGQYVTAGSSTGAIYYSSNYGVSYTASALTGYVATLSCSASGQYQIAGTYGSYLYYSTNYGATWMQSNSPAATWYGTASSSSGQIMMACIVNAGGLIYYSLNYGASWALTNAGPASYSVMSMSQNGLYTLTVVGGGAVYLSTATAAPISLLTNGRVGIGTTAPQATLDVYGSFRATSDLVAQGIYLTPSPANATLIQQYFQKVASTAAPNGVLPFWSSGNGYTAIAAGAPATSAYNGGVLLPDGRVVFVPNFASSIGLFNPMTNTFSSILGMPGNYAYSGGVLLPDGRVLFVPANATTIGLFNPMTSAYSTITGTPGGYGYVGGVLLPDGRVLLVPSSSTTIGFFNPATNTYSTITPTSPSLSGGNAYQCGVLLPDGRVVFVPANAANIGIFNSTTNTFNTIPITAVANAYMGGVLLPDGRVLFVPYSATTLGIFNPTTSTFSTITGIAISNAYAGGVLLPDGRVALIPYSSATVGIFNPLTNTYSTIGITSPGAAFWGGTLLPDGRVVFAPFYSSNIGILTTSMSAPREMCLSPYCNKL